MFTLDVISNGLESDDLHSAIARMLVQPDNPSSISVIRCLPPVLTFKVDRTPSATPLAGSKSNERQIFKILPELYLDRYLASNRRAYVDARTRMAEIDERMEQVREKRRALVVIPVRSQFFSTSFLCSQLILLAAHRRLQEESLTR